MPFRFAIRYTLFSAVLFAMPSNSKAEALGSVSAFVDGKAREWHTISMVQNGQRVATASVTRRGHSTDLHIQAHPEPSFSSKEVLSVEARFSGTYESGDAPRTVEILYTPNGLTGPFWTSRGARSEPQMTIIALDAWGGVGHIVAVVSGEICLRPKLFSQTNPDECRSFSGTIDSPFSVE